MLRSNGYARVVSIRTSGYPLEGVCKIRLLAPSFNTSFHMVSLAFAKDIFF